MFVCLCVIVCTVHRLLVLATCSVCHRWNIDGIWQICLPYMYQSTRFIADLICVWKYIYYIVMIIIIIQMPMFIVLSSWHSHCDPVHLMNVEWWQAAADPQASQTTWAVSLPVGCQSVLSPLPFIIITQPKSCYWFYRPTQDRRLSRPGWLVSYRDGLPACSRSLILVLPWSDVARLHWSRPTSYHCAKLPTTRQCCVLVNASMWNIELNEVS